MELLRCITILLLLVGIVDAARKAASSKRKEASVKPSTEFTTEEFLTNIDYTTFQTFQTSIEKQLGLKSGTLNTDTFRDYYDRRTTLRLSSVLLTALCALCQQANDTQCIEQICNNQSTS